MFSFFIIVSTIWALLHVYVAQRLVGPLRTRGFFRGALYAVFVLVWPLSPSVFFVDSSGEPSALFWRAGNLMVTDLVGRVHWRHVSVATLGPVSAGAAGVACALGRELSFFAG